MKRYLVGLTALAAACSASVNDGEDLAGAGGSGNDGLGSGGGFLPSAGGGSSSESACITETAEARTAPLSLALLVDTSFSMDFELRFQHVKGALLHFVSTPHFDDLGIALQFFPLRAQCSVAAYEAPAVAMADLSSARPAIERALVGRRMFGGTPLVQALSGMGAYLHAFATAHPDRKPVLVLATDGVPDATCSASSIDPPNSLENAAAVARKLAQGTPEIPTFVIGVGEELSALHSIAEAGGTGEAVLVEDGGTAQRDFLAALESIRQRSLACDYSIPAPTSGVIDHENVNVRYADAAPGASPTTFYYVSRAADCALRPEAGWYYDDPANPARVVLCPETCDRVTAAPSARIDIAYGCTRVEVPR